MADLIENTEPGEAPAGAPSGELDALDKIAIEARTTEAEADAAQEAILNPNPEPVVDQAALWAQIPHALGGLLGMAMPELRDAYTPEACQQWGQGMAAVADKYGWDAAESIGRYAPEFMLLTASIPLVVPTVRAIKTHKAIADAKAKEEREKGVTVVQGAPAPANPMDLPPGNFSDPV